MINYNVCRNLNKIYFRDLRWVDVPNFFGEGENLESILTIKSFLEQGKANEAFKISDQKLKEANKDSIFPFRLWHAFVLWYLGQMNHEQFRKLFESIVVAFKDDFFPDFKIAVLHAIEGNFNEAMKFLNNALAKNSEHIPSFKLKFWICYFAQDEE